MAIHQDTPHTSNAHSTRANLSRVSRPRHIAEVTAQTGPARLDHAMRESATAAHPAASRQSSLTLKEMCHSAWMRCNVDMVTGGGMVTSAQYT